MTPTDNGICIGLMSEDSKLNLALSSVLSPEFTIVAQTADPKGWRKAKGDQVDALMLDIDSISEKSALSEELLDDLISSGIPLIVLASDENLPQAVRLVDRGAHGQVRKPPVLRELRSSLRTALENRRLHRELKIVNAKLESLSGLDQLVGSSAPMQEVYGMVRKVAGLDVSVLITGESGTGKELITRAIHNLGKRSNRPFVAVSCSAIPETLIESELFGHEKGAFTGSTGNREGYFEQAGDGTLFLDEIGELNLHTQVKLLRVLQERQFSRLGSNRLIPLRARVVLATHRDLNEMVSAGEFRQDLLYRVNVIEIQAPSLRHRGPDIDGLARHFLLKHSEAMGKAVDVIEPDAMTALRSYSWPGNVRELENVIQRCIILAEGYSITKSSLPAVIQEARISDWEDDVLPNGSFERLLREYKFKLASDAVQQCNGSKTLAAQNLSISRAYLHRILRKGSDSQPVTMRATA